MRERDIENYARKQIKAAGGLMLKWVSPGCRDVPDDIVFWPTWFRGQRAQIHFVEFKAPGKKATRNQSEMHRILRKYHAIVILVDSLEAVDKYIMNNK
jgi:hypothetical protein